MVSVLEMAFMYFGSKGLFNAPEGQPLGALKESENCEFISLNRVINIA